MAPNEVLSTSVEKLTRFADIFRSERFRGERGMNTSRLMVPLHAQRTFLGRLHHGITPRSSRSRMPDSVPLMPTSSHVGDYGYSLIRSDVDEDKSDAIIVPNMPNNAFGVRQRTLANLGGGKPMDDGDQRMERPLEWVDSDWFQQITGVVILLNALAIGLETHFKSHTWLFVEHTFLVYFCFELVVRLVSYGCDFFRVEDEWMWNLFDFVIVIVGVFDEWVVAFFLHSGLVKRYAKGFFGETDLFFTAMRVVRLLRIVRLFRLVRIIRPLHELVIGVLEALQGMFWVLVFMVMTLYSTAILCTRLIGQGDALPPELMEDEEIQRIQKMFLSVQDSTFTLFGTISSWSLMKFVPLFKAVPVLKPVFVLFYVYSAWALLAVMTGVVSENMIAIREQMVKEDEQREEMRKTMITKTLIELFQHADLDHSGTVSRQEFNAMLDSPDLIRKITRNTHMKIKDLHDLFDWLDHDGGGTITIDEFMTGFKWVNEPLRAKSLVKLQGRLAGDFKSLESDVVQGAGARVAEVHKLVTAPLRKVHAITEHMQALDVHFQDVRNIIRDRTQCMPSPENLKSVEGRLLGQVEAAIMQLQRLNITAVQGAEQQRRGRRGSRS